MTQEKEPITPVQTTKVEVSTSTPIWKHILWGVVTVAFFWALFQIPNTLIVFSFAWLIAYLLNPAVEALEGRKLGPVKKCSRGLAVGIVTGILTGILLASASWMLPHLTDQVQNLINLQSTISDPAELPIKLKKKLDPLLDRVPEAYRAEAITRAGTFIQESSSQIGAWVSSAISWIARFLGELLSGVFLVATAFLVSLYMLMNWRGMGGSFLEKLPKRYRDEVESLSVKMNEIFGAYLKATILTSIACMIATFISLLILTYVTGQDFPYKGLVSFVAGIAYPVPVIGIFATSILGGILGFLPQNDLGFGLAVLLTINVVNVLIDRTVQPKLMSDAIGVSELFVLFAAFAGGEIAGVWGMLLGIPVAAMGKALFEWFHVNFLVVSEDTPPTDKADPQQVIDKEKAPELPVEVESEASEVVLSQAESVESDTDKVEPQPE